MKWDSNQYMKFGNERTRPSTELAAQITLAAPKTVIDLGCGPGNSTENLLNRFHTLSYSLSKNIPAIRTAHFAAYFTQIHPIYSLPGSFYPDKISINYNAHLAEILFSSKL